MSFPFGNGGNSLASLQLLEIIPFARVVLKSQRIRINKSIPDFLNKMKRYLEDMEYEVITAMDGLEGAGLGCHTT